MTGQQRSGGKRGEQVKIWDCAGQLVGPAGFADGSVQVGPRLGLIFGLQQVADGRRRCG